jgi:hypothetical protein
MRMAARMAHHLHLCRQCVDARHMTVSTGLANRWPHIARFLDLADTRGDGFDMLSFWRAEKELSPAKQAAANEEWADYFEHRLEQHADELAGDPFRRRLMEMWTDTMAYVCRRCAAHARGKDPGRWIPQHERRPDLDATAGS